MQESLNDTSYCDDNFNIVFFFKVEDDNWYSSDEDDSAPKLTDVLKNLGKKEVGLMYSFFFCIINILLNFSPCTKAVCYL